ncbi:helix-turn-helix transcriptional regulator, partial [Alloalcanivorax gelatiniphagus]
AALEAGEPRPLDERIRAACLCLRRGDGEVGGAELAAAVGLSESRFRHLFREELGVNLKRFQLHLKCQRALTLWRDGMSLTDLALAAGFYDQPHLNRTLRAMFDTLPSRYARAFPVRVEHLDPA